MVVMLGGDAGGGFLGAGGLEGCQCVVIGAGGDERVGWVGVEVLDQRTVIGGEGGGELNHGGVMATLGGGALGGVDGGDQFEEAFELGEGFASGAVGVNGRVIDVLINVVVGFGLVLSEGGDAEIVGGLLVRQGGGAGVFDAVDDGHDVGGLCC